MIIMKFKQRKIKQRKINKIVRNMNKNLQEDNLWRGRFIVHQIYSDWESYEDGSGGCLRVTLNVRDKKTGVNKNYYFDNYSWSWDLFQYVNDFIIYDSHVWDNIQEVKDDITDWSKVK